MDVTQIASLIGSVGFPIACCIYVIGTLSKTIEDLRKTVENNTIALTKLSTLMGVDDDGK